MRVKWSNYLSTVAIRAVCGFVIGLAVSVPVIFFAGERRGRAKRSLLVDWIQAGNYQALILWFGAWGLNSAVETAKYAIHANGKPVGQRGAITRRVQPPSARKSGCCHLFSRISRRSRFAPTAVFRVIAVATIPRWQRPWYKGVLDSNEDKHKEDRRAS